MIGALPRWLVARLGPRPEIRRHIDVLATSSVGIVMLAVADPHRLPATCAFRAVAGVGCPFCGITTSVHDALSGHVKSAWANNEVGLLVAMVIVMQIPLRLLALSGLFPFDFDADVRASRVVNGLIIVLCLLRFLLRAA